MSGSALRGETTVEVADVAVAFAGVRTVVLLAHINPDADSLGSALALGLALEALGVDVQVAFDSPVVTPESLSELPGQHLICTSVRADPDLAVSLDAASSGRLGALAAVLDTAGSSLVIDHHGSNTGFGRLNWIDPTAEATAVMVAALLDEMSAPITADIAANLYAGLATDTVNFRFATAAGHALAARLVDTGVHADTVLRPITDTHPFRWLGMLGSVLSHATLHPAAAAGAGLVVVTVSTVDALGLRQEELDSVIDIARTAAEAAVAAVVKQTEDLEWQVSLRGRDAVDVARVATALGGGGHPRAAGYTHRGGHDDLLAELLRTLDEVAAGP